MEAQNRIPDRILLENGLEVHFVDQTRPPVAGRCQVQLLIRIPLEAEAAHFENHPDPAKALEEFTSLAGSDPVEFRVVKVRNFKVENQVSQMIEEMKEEFTRANLEYLKKPAFAGNFIRKRYEELRQEHAVRKAHEEALERYDR